MPIPVGLLPNRTASAPNISYPEDMTSALMTLAGGATTYFGLRFSGERSTVLHRVVPDGCSVSYCGEDAGAPSVGALCMANPASRLPFTPKLVLCREMHLTFLPCCSLIPIGTLIHH